MDFAIEWARGNPALTNKVAFICPANDKRVGGDWETGVSGCEERLCRRSTLSVTLSTPADGQGTNYPIPTEGVILSPEVGACPSSRWPQFLLILERAHS